LQTRVSREQRPCNQRRLVGAKIAAQCCIMPSDPGNPFFLTLSSVMQNAYTQWLTCWRLDSLGIVLGQSHFCVCVWLLKSVLWWQSHASNDIRGVLCGFLLFVRSMCGLHMYVICFRKRWYVLFKWLWSCEKINMNTLLAKLGYIKSNCYSRKPLYRVKRRWKW
jgi:hypothetical protein